MTIQWETVAIPVTRGIDVNTRARLVEPGMLLEAINSRFSGGGSEKRRGHVARRVRGNTPIPPDVTITDWGAPGSFEPFYTGDRGLPSDWIFGWGRYFETRTDHGTRNQVSRHPDVGIVFGAAQRDNETLLWDGWQFYSRTPTSAPLVTVGDAVLPHLRSATIAKCSQAQNQPDAADNGVIRVVAWINPVTDKAVYTVLDATTGATFVPPTALVVPNPTYAVRCIPVGGWIHVVCSDTAGTLLCFSVNGDTPTALSTTSLGPCDRFFDMVKVTEEKWCVLRNTGSKSIAVSFLLPDGQNANVVTPVWTSSALDPLEPWVTELGSVGLAVDPIVNNVAVIYRRKDGGQWSVSWRAFTSSGVALTGVTTLETIASGGTSGVCIAPKYVTEGLSDESVFDVYWDRLTSVKGARVSVPTPTPVLAAAERHNLALASQAFRVGDRTYVWASHTTTYQNSWYLLDEKLLPVGHLDYGTANSPAASGVLASVNWSGTAPVKDTLVFHLALGYKVRVATETKVLGTNTPAVYAEPSTRFVQLDYLPVLRSAQAGRSLYFAGAQLSTYDGKIVSESGFHHAPVVTVDDVGGGALTVGGKYRYRVDACYTNAQGEEVRSNSFYTDEITIAGDRTIRLTIQPMLTRRETAAYFLVFRNENTQTQWYLINSRDPDNALYLDNDTSVASFTFDDAGAVTDAALISRETHPGNGGFGYLDSITAPACEIVAAGADRLWLAGGELPPGQVAPSRLFSPRETPSFHPLVNAQIDRSAEPVTAIGFVGEFTAIFRHNSTYIQEGFGPDNSSQGGWPPARLALVGVGAISQESLAVIPGGLLFQSPAGIRGISAGGALAPVGLPTDRMMRGFAVSAAFVSPTDEEVRWYSRTGGCVVYNYRYESWSTWTVNAAGVTPNPVTRLALVADPNGYLWEETAGVYRDNNVPYLHKVRFPWLRAGALIDFQRVRRVAGVGEATTTHACRLIAYYDEKDYAGEVIEWDWPEDDIDPSYNTDEFGNNSFGAGTFGDTESNPLPIGFSPYIYDPFVFNVGETKISTETEHRDSVWRWRRRLNRQKCSVLSISLDDNYSDGPGFTLTAIGLDIGKKSGLDRMPWRGGTSVTAQGTTTIRNGK